MSVIRISSDTLINIEQNFRVSAGPGAGKTYWLTKHIENVLHNSTRLGRSQKIACITYTNTAVETISERLKDTNDCVEISTIHSFLYRNLVRYYIQFVSNEFGFDATRIDGHDDTIISNYKFIEDLFIRSNFRFALDQQQMAKLLKGMRWHIDATGELVLIHNRNIKFGKYSIKKEIPFEYKIMAWEQGVLHHDDVLFFSLILIRKYPFIKRVLRSGFPYIFIDEFQDTSPLQAEILKEIAQENCVLGIIGDVGQAIYGFQGSSPAYFSSGIGICLNDFIIEKNFRSTNEIVDILNKVRGDIKQSANGDSTESDIMIIVGDPIACYEIVLTRCNSAELKILARTNDTINSLKYNLAIDKRVGDLLSKFENCDTNNHRRKTILRTIEGIELARSANFQRALKSIKKIFKDMEQDLIIPSSISYLKRALDDYQQYCDCTIYDFRDYIDSTLKVNTPRYSRGKAFDFTSDITYQQMAASISLEAEKSNFLTIHKAKGDEYDAVLLSLVREADLSFLISPELGNNEEHRIYYVAISRAKRNLYINVPTLTENNEKKMYEFGFEVVRLEDL